MAKPIGNLVANMPVQDKVSFRVKAKFESKPAEKKAETNATKTVKYKKRKR